MTAKNKTDVDDEPVALDVGIGGGNIGVIASAVERGVDIIFIKNYLLPGMSDPQVPNMSPMTLLSGGIVSRRALNGIMLAHGVVKSAGVTFISDVSRWVNNHPALLLAKDVTNGG